MKKFTILVIAMAMLSGCGVMEGLGDGCQDSEGLESACHAVFGGAKDRDQDNQIDSIKKRLTSLESEVVVIRSEMDSQGQTINMLNVDLQNAIASNSASVASIQSQLTAAQAALVTQQTSLNAALTSIAVLQGNTSIIAVLDPCGVQGTNANEVLLKLTDGTLLASFSDSASGMNTRFSVLKDGNYVTSDGTLCFFTVTAGTLSNEHN